MKTLAVIALVAGLCACTSIQKLARTPQEVLECKAEVIRPYVGDICETVVAQAEGGQMDLAQLLMGLGVKAFQLPELDRQYRACSQPAPAAQPPAPAEDDGVVNQ